MFWWGLGFVINVILIVRIGIVEREKKGKLSQKLLNGLCG